MKKLLLVSVCLILAFSACKKDSKTTTSNTITATIGGTNFNFSTSATAEVASSSGVYGLLVNGSTGTGSSAQAISIVIDSQNPIAKGTYILNSSTTSNATSLPEISYTESASISNPLSFTSDITGTNSTTITITSISSTNIQGTFSGVLISDQDGTTTLTSSGKFNVSVIAAKQQ